MTESIKGIGIVKLEQEPTTIQLRELTLMEDLAVETEHGDRVIIPAGTVLKVSEPLR